MGRYLLVNRRYEELFHVKKESILGRLTKDIFPAEVAERLSANDRAVIAAGKPLALEERIPLDDGLHTYLSMKFPLADPDGNLAGVCGIATDITELRQLESSSRYLAAIVESSDDAIIAKDLNGVITSWNRAAERIFGYMAAEILGKPVSILAAPGHHDEMPDILSRIKRGERVEHYETRRCRQDGQIIDVSLTVSPVRDADGRIVGASKIARNISDRKRAEKVLADLLSREKEARRTAELLNRVGPRLAAQLDPEKLLQEVIDIATALIGAECGAFFQNAVNEQGESHVLRAVSGVPREMFEDIALPPDSGIVRCEDWSLDSRFGTFLANLRIRSYLQAPVVARSGEVLGHLFFGHSITRRFTAIHESIITGIAAQAAIAMDNARLFEQTQWAQAELKRSNEELRRANRDLEVFAYSASHDLQEPLRTIAISAQLIERSWGSNWTASDASFLTNIYRRSPAHERLIEDLLAYTRRRSTKKAPRLRSKPARVLGSAGELAGTDRGSRSDRNRRTACRMSRFMRAVSRKYFRT